MSTTQSSTNQRAANLPIPPHSLESECSLLAAILMFPTDCEDAFDEVKADDFYRKRHGVIYQAARDLYAIGEPVNAASVADYLRTRRQYDEAGGAAYLSKLLDYPAMIDHAKARILDCALKRRLIVLGHRIYESGFDPGKTAMELLDSAAGELASVEAPDKVENYHISDIVEQAVERYQERRQNQGVLAGVTTGYQDLDRYTRGFKPGNLVIVAGRPSMGKTALAVNMMYRQSRRGVPVGIFSLEQPKEQLADRIFAIASKIDLTKFETGFFTDDEWRKIDSSAAALFERNMIINEKGGLHYNEIRRHARRMKRKHGVEIIYVDYLGLVARDNDRATDATKIGRIAKAMKSIAKDLEIPVVLLSQLNRETAKDADKRPKLHQLRDSGEIEQDADVVLFVHRPEMYLDSESPEYQNIKGHAEIIIAKQRQGPAPWTVHLTYLEKFTRFEEVEKRYGGYTP